jgi:hypothetical protein
MMGKSGWAFGRPDNGRYRKQIISNALALTDGKPMQHPNLIEWMMGFPRGWTDVECSETPSSHKSPN